METVWAKMLSRQHYQALAGGHPGALLALLNVTTYHRPYFYYPLCGLNASVCWWNITKN